MNNIKKFIAVFALATLGLIAQTNIAFAAPTNITCSSATLHGYIAPSGGPSTVWFEWGTNSSSVSGGSGSRTSSQTFSVSSYFESDINGLNENTTYYYRAAAQNSRSTVYGEVNSFKTSTCTTPPGDNMTVTTNSATTIQQTSARLNGNVNTNGTSGAVRWFEYGRSSGSLSYSTSEVSINSSNDVSSYISDLSQNTTYYFRLAARNAQGTVYGRTLSFTTGGGTSNQAPVATTNAATNIEQSGATLNGYVDTNDSTDTTRWFEYGRSSGNLSDSTSHNSISNSGSVSAFVSGLSSNTTYYFRIVAQNDAGTSYGSVRSFMTSNGGGNNEAPVATTNAATDIQTTSATLAGYVDTNGSSDTERWFEWGTSSGNLYHTTSRNTIGYSGSASANISSLSNNTTYYFRLVAQNDAGTSRGDVRSFTTRDGGTDNGDAPIATTNAATDIQTTSATLTGYVDTNGSSDTERWFEWGTSSGNLYHTTSRNTIGYSGYATAGISSLSSNTTYYFRLVAQNDAGTSRGDVRSFTTRDGGGDNNDDRPAVTTRSATAIDTDSATLNGYVDTNGTSNVSRWFEYGRSSGNLDRTTSRSNIGYSGDASAYISDLSNDTTYYFRIAARNDNGTVYGSVYSFTTRTGGSSSNYPLVTTRSATGVDADSATINGYVEANGGSDTYAWFEWGRSSGDLSNTTTRRSQGSSDSTIAASLSGLNADTTYYYRAVAQNSRGTARGSVLSFTTSRNGNGNTGLAPTAITTLPTGITGSSATFNSLVLQADGEPSTAWFEWGTSQSLGRRTTSRNIGTVASVRHAEYVSGLSNGTTYYFRVVAENSNGRNYGIIRSFVARSAVIPTPTPKPPVKKPVVVVQKPTVVVEHAEGVASLVMLTITGESDTVRNGASQSYAVTWRNTSGQDLRNVVLRILIPQTLSFESADAGTYSKIESMHTLEIGELRAGETGEMNIVLKGTATLKTGDLVVTTANLVYTDEGNIQGDALAYTTQRVVAAGSVLGASVAGIGGIPMALFGWLLLIILLIVLIILVNHLYRRLTCEKQQTQQ